MGTDRADFWSAIAGRVGSTFCRVGSGRVGSKKSDPWTTLITLTVMILLTTMTRTIMTVISHNNIIIDDHDIDGPDIIDDHDIDGYDTGNHSINVYYRIFVSESHEYSFLEAVSMATFKLCIAATLLRRLLYIMFAEIGREKLRPRWRRDCLSVSDNNSCLNEVSHRDL